MAERTKGRVRGQRTEGEEILRTRMGESRGKGKEFGLAAGKKDIRKIWLTSR